MALFAANQRLGFAWSVGAGGTPQKLRLSIDEMVAFATNRCRFVM